MFINKTFFIMILVTGANGYLGSAVIDSLMEKNPGIKVAGLVREKLKGHDLAQKGVELRIGDYLDCRSLEDAMKGIDILCFISSSSLDSRVLQHRNVIDAAKKAGVKHLIYTSMLQADKLLSPLSADHFQTENLIRESGIYYTIFRNAFYQEYLPYYIGNAIEGGTWYFPSDGKKLNFVSRIEIAEAMANVLLKPVPHINRIYEITSPTSYTLEAIADEITTILGKELNYIDLTLDAFIKQMEQEGLPSETIMARAGIGLGFANGALDYTDPVMETLIGRIPQDTKEFLHQYLSHTVPSFHG